MNQFIKDVRAFSAKMEHDTAVRAMGPIERNYFLAFRCDCMQEEVGELGDAIESGDAEEIVDAILDMVYFGLGTLELFSVDTEEAWRRIHAANMEKFPGIKPERPNVFKLPDAIKPDGWEAPDLTGTTGIIRK